MLSVIVPIYNVGYYLPKCIESIIGQSYKELEILLIDDGSTDSCPEICDSYAQIDHRIKVVHKKNGGLVKARKTGLDRASGEYIAFVDGDDWIEKDMYLKLMEVMRASDVDFIDSSIFYDREENSYIEKKIHKVYDIDSYTRHRFFKTLICLDNFIKISPSIWSKLFKADLIRKTYAHVPDNMQYGEDVINLIYCFLKSCKTIQIEDAFYHYNYRDSSMSHSKDASHLRKEFVLWNYCGNIILEHDRTIQQEDIDKFLFRKMYFVLNNLNTYEFDMVQCYVFPCVEMLFNKKIVIYGAGRVGRDYVTQIARYEKCDIVCWIDRNYKNIQLNYREVKGIENILEKTYDIVLLAVIQRQTADEMRKILLEYEVPESKIVWIKPGNIFDIG